MPEIKLNHRLMLEEQSQVPDGAGGRIATWRRLGVVYGAVRALSGRSDEVGGGTISQTRYEVTVRAAPLGDDSRPKPNQRFVTGGQVLMIDAVLPKDPQGRYLACRAHEQVAS